MKIGERKLKVKAKAGFPKQLYLSIVDWLADQGYEVKKAKDWLEVSPESREYQRIMQKRQKIDERRTNLLEAQSQLRKGQELIKHDLRKLRQHLEHFEEGDEHTLKSHFVDSVDRNLDKLSILHMVNKGIFPTLKDDFMKAESEEWIKKADITESEKGVLRKKWRVYQHWKKYYGSEVGDKVKTLESELSSKKAGLKDLRKKLRSCTKSLKQLEISEEIPITEPKLLEGHISKLAGVRLMAWKSRKDYGFFTKLDFRKTTYEGRKPKVEVELDLCFHLLDKKEFKKRQEEIKALEEEVKSGMGFTGERAREEKKSGSKSGLLATSLGKVVETFKGKKKEGPPENLKRIACQEFEELWKFIKSSV